MHEVTGDREAVLRLMKDTMAHFSRGGAKPVKRGARSASLAARAKASTERDQIVEKLDEGYQREAERKTARAAGLSVGRERAVEGWYAPREQAVALFQAAMDEYLSQGTGATAPGKTGSKGKARSASLGAGAPAPSKAGLDSFYKPAKTGTSVATAIGDQYTNLDPRWVEVAWEKAKLLFRGKHAFRTHKSMSDFRFRMANETTVAIVGDWGGGNAAAQAVAAQIRRLAPTHVIHLGDVYYAGTPKEVEDRFLKFWPTPAAPGLSFALNSNHEMYSGGYGYFDTTLKRFKQPASYFSLANDHWRFIGLDTGYIDHDLNAEQTEWLLGQFKGANPKTILLSHHQLFSAYESTDASRLQSKVRPLLEGSKIYGWIWGHEHLCVVYQPHLGVKAICLGNGCFPYKAPATAPKVPVQWLDNRIGRGSPEFPGTHTFALLRLRGPEIQMEFIDQDGNSASPLTWT